MTGESTVQKVKEVLHIGSHKDKDHTTSSTTHNTTGTTGTHVPGTTHNTTGTTGTHVPGTTHNTTGTTGTHVPGTTHNTTGTTGTHVPGTTHNTTGTTGTHIPGTTHTGHAEGSHGPHSSAAANAVDPRVDSDLDGNRLPNKTSAGYGTQDAAYGTTGTHTGTHTGAHVPGTTGHQAYGHTGTTGTTGTHIPGTTHTGHSEGSHGPHSSAAANAVDPRVDSDLDGNRLPNKTSAGYGTQDTYGSGLTGTHHQGTTAGNTVGGTGFGGGISHSTNAGPHNSNIANTADPRVDSDLSSTGNRHGASTGHSAFGVSGSHATPGSGTAQNTAGPHNSDMLNKADPRVDADLDGSKTLGGNKTYQ
ncbi:putative cell surface protein [Botrytis fragariae]|uniref:Putative cell surface protein n=1 Tax=Botrytis fragariae TaxID=1964551 RepID=A0A8H6ELV7_9HELO|nr:putative cell surface protein [Botrytis fragariae]KAF5876944.1 putative cell surface protein [Botrytis fragariae]